MGCVLSDQDLRRRLAAGGGLVVSPAPQPQDIQPASIDIHLDLSRGAKRPALLPVGQYVEVTEGGILGAEWAHDACEGDELILQPHAFALACTLERITIPHDLGVRVDGRSTFGRIGLAIHVTAGWCDPGFEGQVTLELVNHNPVWPIRLSHLARLGQLQVVRLSSECERPYSAQRGSHYNGQMGATCPTAGGER
jgi:dCTP deaminase